MSARSAASAMTSARGAARDPANASASARRTARARVVEQGGQRDRAFVAHALAEVGVEISSGKRARRRFPLVGRGMLRPFEELANEARRPRQGFGKGLGGATVSHS